MFKAMERIDTDMAARVYPRWFYSRIDLVGKARQYFTLSYDFGFVYLLRFITVNYPVVLLGAANKYGPTLRVEFFSTCPDISRQSRPIPVDLISTPAGVAEESAVAGAPAAAVRWLGTQSHAAPVGTGIDFTASQLGSHKVLNYIYPNESTLKVEITGQDLADPVALDLLLCGFYIPEKLSGLWGAS